MKLEDLGNEYLKSIKALDEIISAKKSALKTAERKRDYNTALALKHDIHTLNEMRHDCLVIGYQLTNYYKEEVPKRYVRRNKK